MRSKRLEIVWHEGRWLVRGEGIYRIFESAYEAYEFKLSKERPLTLVRSERA